MTSVLKISKFHKHQHHRNTCNTKELSSAKNAFRCPKPLYLQLLIPLVLHLQPSGWGLGFGSVTTTRPASLLGLAQFSFCLLRDTNFQKPSPLYSRKNNGHVSPTFLLCAGWARQDPKVSGQLYRLIKSLPPWSELHILIEVYEHIFHSTARVKWCSSEKPSEMMLVSPWYSVPHSYRPLLQG